MVFTARTLPFVDWNPAIIIRSQYYAIVQDPLNPIAPGGGSANPS